MGQAPPLPPDHLECLTLLWALQVDAEGGYAQNGSVDANQPLLEATRLRTHHHAAGKREVAIKPCVPQTPAVALDIQLRDPG